MILCWLNENQDKERERGKNDFLIKGKVDFGARKKQVSENAYACQADVFAGLNIKRSRLRDEGSNI